MAAEPTAASMNITFTQKFEEFVRDLLGACPELTADIQAALQIPAESRIARFREEVLASCSPTRDPTKCPSKILPGVTMPESLWSQLSDKTHKAIQEYLTILAFCCLMDGEGATGAAGADGWSEGFAKTMMEDLKAKMSGMDFSGIAEKIAKMFGSDLSGAAAGAFPQIPEKFLKGQIAKLAEDIVKEFRVEDLGIDPASMEAAGNDPGKALGLIMDLFTKNPGRLQDIMMKLTKKLQQKVVTGALRPQELVREAEELMKTFQENPQFVEMMETFRQAFGMGGDGEDLAEAQRAAGRDGDSRLSIARARLRKKLEAKKDASGKGK